MSGVPQGEDGDWILDNESDDQLNPEDFESSFTSGRSVRHIASSGRERVRFLINSTDQSDASDSDNMDGDANSVLRENDRDQQKMAPPQAYTTEQGRDIHSVGNPQTGINREPELSLMEKQYLLSAERGDLSSVRHFIQFSSTNKDFNLNCIDPLGRTALLIAIENENIEMIEVLIEANITTGDAILYAISEENVEAVEIILNHLEKSDKFTPDNQGVEINEHSAFTPDITPIILAAHKDNYEIIKLLLDRGASIPHPHDVRCACKECLLSVAEDSLRLSRSRINAYRALASPSLICLSARDPVLYAFELSSELRRLSFIENEFKTDYQELSHKCQKFSVDLLDQIRGSKELEIILNHDTTDRWPIKERAPGERMQLARLKLAIQFRQKRFVAHPNCQQLLASMWYEGLPGFRRRNIVFKMLLIFLVSLSSPFLAIFYLLAPKSTLGHIVRKPFIKFLCHSASYCMFLFLLILASQRINYDEIFSLLSHNPPGNNSMTTPADRKERRGPPPTPVECAIAIWVVGLIWVEVKQLWDMGLYEYCHNMWNILDFITNCLYICTGVLRTIAYCQVESELRDPLREHIGRHLQRRLWDAWDPTLISECLFATANIFSSLKLVHIFTVNPHLGPLQISLGRMIVDIIKFFFVYWLVLFAFACGLNQLFWYYATMRAQECEWSKSHEAIGAKIMDWEDSCDPKYSSFSNLFKTLETLFWSTFGLIDLMHLRMTEDHFITKWVGTTMFGSYNIISVVVLLNMLIAMMSNSYAIIDNQADVEWKFARSRLWIEYFDDSGTLPPPCNIIPSPKSFYYMLRWFCDRFCKWSRRIQQTKQRSLRKSLQKVSEQIANYKFVTRNLVKRYIAHVQRVKEQSSGVSEDDVNEIKQDISAFRYELLEILRNAGMATGHANYAQKTSSRGKKRSALAERRLMKGFQMTVDPIPEVDRFLPQKPNLNPSESRRPHLSHKTSSTPTFAKTFDKISRLSKKMTPISKRFHSLAHMAGQPTESKFNDKHPLGANRTDDNRSQEQPLLDRSATVELQQICEYDDGCTLGTCPPLQPLHVPTSNPQLPTSNPQLPTSNPPLPTSNPPLPISKPLVTTSNPPIPTSNPPVTTFFPHVHPPNPSNHYSSPGNHHPPTVRWAQDDTKNVGNTFSMPTVHQLPKADLFPKTIPTIGQTGDSYVWRTLKSEENAESSGTESLTMQMDAHAEDTLL